MHNTCVALILSTLVLLPVGIVYTADQSSNKVLAGPSQLSSTVSVAQYIAVGLVGSQVMERIIQVGSKTVIVDAVVPSGIGANQILSAN
tara:strand:- start:765 stop:1031 length:267 start_codon:yes stop_codon:yes gene_type:complete